MTAFRSQEEEKNNRTNVRYNPAEEKRPLVILTGPTAVGKTKTSIMLAKRIGGEIISADSMQVYRGMDIGSAKIRKEEMEGVPHHLIDMLEPDEEFNVVLFQKKAKEAMDGIYRRGRIPILVGGTGFYIQAVLYDIDFTSEQSDGSYRARLAAEGEEKGAEYLHDMLRKTDPESAEEIPANNKKRVIRALEYYHLTGQKISEHNREQRQKESPYHFCYFVLYEAREILYERINRRVDEMLAQGLLGEVEGLKKRGMHRNMVSMQGLGYKELLEYLEGECTLQEAVYRLKRDTRHFAKRQMTWFKREREVEMLDMGYFRERPEELYAYMETVMKRKHVWEG